MGQIDNKIRNSQQKKIFYFKKQKFDLEKKSLQSNLYISLTKAIFIRDVLERKKKIKRHFLSKKCSV